MAMLKSSNLLTYTGASLAAISLVYIFGPIVFPSYRYEGGSKFSEKPSYDGVVGLTNIANECYINSVLQALAASSRFRNFLAEELHRRRSNGLEEGIITVALNDILDRLNESPSTKKIISARGFIISLERVSRARISSNQQDAQEFLQAVTEKLCDEIVSARKAAKLLGNESRVFAHSARGKSTETLHDGSKEWRSKKVSKEKTLLEDWGAGLSFPRSFGQYTQPIVANDELGSFPFEGQLLSQIECLSCHFKPKPTTSTFVTLTLSVPAKSSTSLDSCFDNLTKVENIDDFRCEVCRMNHALELKERALHAVHSPDSKKSLQTDITIIRNAIRDDPESVPDRAHLPPISDAPKRRIARYTQISRFPKVLAIHLSRSIFNAAIPVAKNMAQVSFPDHLSLGGLLCRTNYKLCAMISHRGAHCSGHYESFRRQHAPVDTLSDPLLCNSITASRNPSSEQRLSDTSFDRKNQASQRLKCANEPIQEILCNKKILSKSKEQSSTDSENTTPSPSQEFVSLTKSRSQDSAPKHNPVPLKAAESIFKDAPDAIPGNGSCSSKRDVPEPCTSIELDSSSLTDTGPPQISPSLQYQKLVSQAHHEQPKTLPTERSQQHQRPHKTPLSNKRQLHNDKWWRISDETAWEVRTSDVLAMQKDVYLLFYERND